MGEYGAQVGAHARQHVAVAILRLLGNAGSHGKPGTQQKKSVDEAGRAQTEQQPPPRKMEPEGERHQRRPQQRPHRVQQRGTGKNAVRRSGVRFHQNHIPRVRQRPRPQPIDAISDDEESERRGQSHEHGGNADEKGSPGQQPAPRPHVNQQAVDGFNDGGNVVEDQRQEADLGEGEAEQDAHRRHEDVGQPTEQLVEEARAQPQKNLAIRDAIGAGDGREFEHAAPGQPISRARSIMSPNTPAAVISSPAPLPAINSGSSS